MIGGGAVTERAVGERSAVRRGSRRRLVSGGCEAELVGVELQEVVGGVDQSPFGAAC